MKKIGNFILCGLLMCLFTGCFDYYIKSVKDVAEVEENIEDIDIQNDDEEQNEDKTSDEKTYDEEYYKSLVENFWNSITDSEEMQKIIEENINLDGVIVWYAEKGDFVTNLNDTKQDKELKKELKQFLLNQVEENKDNGYQIRITDVGKLEKVQKDVYKMIVGIRFKPTKRDDWKIEEKTFIFYDGKIIDIISDYDKITKSFFNSVLAPKFFKLNERYYKVDDEYGYSWTFKKNGDVEYHLDKKHTKKLCDDSCMETEPGCCEDFEYSDKVIQDMLNGKNYYTIDNEFIKVTAKDGFYNGWHYCYDVCEIVGDKLKCDNYNAYHGDIPEYVYTIYYELRN